MEALAWETINILDKAVLVVDNRVVDSGVGIQSDGITKILLGPLRKILILLWHSLACSNSDLLHDQLAPYDARHTRATLNDGSTTCWGDERVQGKDSKLVEHAVCAANDAVEVLAVMRYQTIAHQDRVTLSNSCCGHDYKVN